MWLPTASYRSKNYLVWKNKQEQHIPDFDESVVSMKKDEIYIIHGTNYRDMTKQLLEAADLADMIGGRDKTIALKPNLVNASAPSYGATTHTELAAGVIQYLQEHGFSHISIMESSWVGEKTARAFHASGFDHLCEAYQIPFADLQQDTFQTYDAAGMPIAVCDRAMQADFLINMPVLKGHAQTHITCALKNSKGLIPNREKRRFHTMGLHEPIAHLNTVVRQDFILVDNICGDLDFEEGGNPVAMNRILGFADPVLCDTFVCHCMGFTPEEVPYIRIAERLGVGSTSLDGAKIRMLNEPQAGMGEFPKTNRIRKLVSYTEERDACSACYGALIHALGRLQEEGKLSRALPPVCIGQGFQGKTGELGVGNCTRSFRHSCPGCPPQAGAIREFLTSHLEA